jgi:signal transduction histidine kinase
VTIEGGDALVQLESDAVADEVLLEPEQAAARSAERDHVKHTSTTPKLRWFGFTILALAGLPLANAVLLDAWSWPSFIGYAIAVQLYTLLSWLLLKRYYQASRADLSNVFLVLDIALLFVAVHLTGGADSWLFWLPLVRVADQIPTGYRRVAWFSITAVVGYVLFLAIYPILGQPIDWTAALARTLLLAGAALYICLSARTSEEARLTRLHSIDFARELILKLNQKSEQLQRQSERVQLASRSKSEFLARVSHELRRPATTIIGFAQLLELAELNARQQEYVNRIVRAGRDLSMLIDEVMDLAEVQSGQAKLRLEAIDFDDLLEDVLTALWPAAADRGIRLARIGTDSVPAPILADRRALRRVIINVIWHALRSSSPEDEVSVWTEATGQRLRLYTQDSGRELPPQPVRELLSSNFTLEQELARLNELGLGLAFAKMLTLKLDGRMGAETTVGRGTMLWVELPMLYSGQSETAGQSGQYGSERVRPGPRLLTLGPDPTRTDPI